MHPSHDQSNNNSGSYSTAIPFSENDMSSFPKLDDSSNNSLFNFPNSPHTHHADYEAVYLHFYELLYAHQCLNVSAETIGTSPKTTKKLVEEVCPNEQPSTKKRCSKKDRHSKINTMHGPRDRRMRLSLDVARKFFNLQDLLGFDKPSKTVDWLLKSSGTAITELLGGLDPSKSSNSEPCEQVVDSVSGSMANLSSTITVELETTSLMSAKRKKVEKKIKATVARDSRMRARERARERTSQKKRLTEERIVWNTCTCARPCSSLSNCKD